MDLSASITGIVKDYNTGSFVSNCQVTLEPTGQTVVTNSNGAFNFLEVDPGTYNITYKKAGYADESKIVNAVSGQQIDASVLLKAKSAFALSETNLDFGDLNSSMSFYVFNNSDERCSYEISGIPSWANFNQTSGTVAENGGQNAITVTVDRTVVDYGTYSQSITVKYNGKSKGEALLTISMKKVILSTPTVSIVQHAEAIAQNSFNIRGNIVATGGSEITNYGHCWSTSKNPTISDYKNDLGSTKETGEYISTITGLATATTYYVRAYATNSLGTSYSNEIAVTTQNIESDKWDGTDATKFADGSGTFADPYIIKTGAQLSLIRNYSDSYFRLERNIDLNSIEWVPIKNFSGTFDGNNFIIQHLKISHAKKDVGLFSNVTGVISNLIIENVEIDGSTANNVGSICGNLCGGIKNCRIILNNISHIKGNENVGGLVGYNTDGDSSHKSYITNCTVLSDAKDYNIIGNSCVGGLCGYSSCLSTSYNADLIDIEDCYVTANVIGEKYVGGISGCNAGIDVRRSSFSGKISGHNKVGGICGSGGYIRSCKAEIEMYVEEGTYTGGLIGHGGTVYSSYSTGTIVADGSSSYIGGISGSGSIYCSYSTVTGAPKGETGFYGIVGRVKECYLYDCITTDDRFGWGGSPAREENCEVNAEGNDIINHLKYSNSKYISNWNFNNTWTWSGKVNDKDITVLCPKLSWEK